MDLERRTRQLGIGIPKYNSKGKLQYKLRRKSRKLRNNIYEDYIKRGFLSEKKSEELSFLQKLRELGFFHTIIKDQVAGEIINILLNTENYSEISEGLSQKDLQDGYFTALDFTKKINKSKGTIVTRLQKMENLGMVTNHKNIDRFGRLRPRKITDAGKEAKLFHQDLKEKVDYINMEYSKTVLDQH